MIEHWDPNSSAMSPTPPEQVIALPQNRKLVNLGCSTYQLPSLQALSQTSLSLYLSQIASLTPTTSQHPQTPAEPGKATHMVTTSTYSLLSHTTAAVRAVPRSSVVVAPSIFVRRVRRGGTGARSRARCGDQKRWVTFSFLFLRQANNSWVATTPATSGEQRAFLPCETKGSQKAFPASLVVVVVATQPHSGLVSFYFLLALAFSLGSLSLLGVYMRIIGCVAYARSVH